MFDRINAFMCNDFSEMISNPQGFLQGPKKVQSGFFASLEVYTDAREASTNAAQSLFVSLATTKGRKSRR
jgi:hypothetical protein